MRPGVSRFAPSTLRRVALTTGFVCIALILAELVLAFANRHAAIDADLQAWNFPDILDSLTNLGVPVIGMVLASRAPANKIGWVFLVAAIGIGISGFSQQYAIYALRADPGSLPAPLFFGWLANWTWPIALCMLLFLFLLFPDGHLRSRRWLPVGWVAGGLLALLTLGSLFISTATWSHPLNQGEPSGTLFLVANVVFTGGFFSIPLVLIAAFVSVALRFRSSVGEERLQLKWFATAGAFVAFSFALSVPLSWSPITARKRPEGGEVHFAVTLDFSRSSFSTPEGSRFPRPTSTRVPVSRRTIFQRKCDALIRKWISSRSSRISLFSTTTIVDSWPSGFSQKDAKSWRPSNSFAARRIAPRSRRSRTHQTKRLSNALRRREMR